MHLNLCKPNSRSHVASCSRLAHAQQQRPCAAHFHVASMHTQQQARTALAYATPEQQQQQQDQEQMEPQSSDASTGQRSKDGPDMGPKTKRQVKIPIPKRSNSTTCSAATAEAANDAGTDPDSLGFKERALLMGLLESMDPETQSQFERFMESQLQQLEQEQQHTAAVDFLQAALDKAADKALNPGQFFETKEGGDAMWQVLREQFTAEEVAVLDGVLGNDWASFGGRALQPDTVRRISALGAREQALLANVLSQISGMSGQLDSFETSMERGQQAPSSSSSSTGGSKSSWGSSFKKKKADRVHGTRKGSGVSRGAAAEQYWDSLLDDGMAAKVQKMMALAGQAAKGQLQFGLPPSRHFMTLKQIYQQMLQLETAQLQQPGSIQPTKVSAAYASINAQLNKLVAQGDDIEDTATRSALLYMDALFNSSSGDDGTERVASSSTSSSSWGGVQAGSGAATAAAAAAAATMQQPESSLAGRPQGSIGGSSTSNLTDLLQQQVQASANAAAGPDSRSPPAAATTTTTTTSSSSSNGGDGSSRSSGGGGVSLQKLQRLGRFLKAAESLEPFQTLLSVLSEKQPHLASEEILQLSNLGGDDWFIQPELHRQAYAAAQAAAEAHAVLKVRAGRGQDSSSSSSSAASAVSAALLPFVDESRVEALAALDPDNLWFMAELAAEDFSEDVLLKWSLHPQVGQRMLSGAWLNEMALPQQLKDMYAHAQVPEFMATLNFDIRQRQQRQ